MNKQELVSLQKLSQGVGQFIRYWGFRKIHGEIWALVYLSARPLSGIEIGEMLKVSKALVSPALKELEAEGLILRAESENSKTKRYVAESDVARIIQSVLKRREVPMIDKIHRSHDELSKVSAQNDAIDPQRLEKMGFMIQMAQVSLASLVATDPFWQEP